MKKAFNSFLMTMMVLNLLMIVFSLIIGQVQGAMLFGIFAIMNFLTLNFDIFIEDTMNFLNKVVNLFGGFKTFQYICIMSDEKIFWLEEFTEGAATGGFFVRNTLKEFIKKLEDDGKEVVGIKIDDTFNLEVIVKSENE